MTDRSGNYPPSTAQPTTTGASLGTSSGLGQTEQSGSDKPAGSHGAVSGDNARPSNLHEGISQASIKSGVIGFGPGQRQGHAARPAEDPIEEGLEHDQVLGGGNTGRDPTTATQFGGASQAPRTLTFISC
jgi:hypothetical protein